MSEMPKLDDTAIDKASGGSGNAAVTQKLRRIIDEGVTLGLALEWISAADAARVK
jgi:hypothetical protein